MAAVEPSLFEQKTFIVSTTDRYKRNYLFLPDTMSEWPWPRRINLYHEDPELTVEATAWLESFQPFKPGFLDACERCGMGNLVSLVYPDVSREALRIGFDLMSVFMVVDEYTDGVSTPVVQELVGVVIDALHNPEKSRPEGEFMLGEMMRQFWERARTTATPEAAKHFVGAFTDYLDSVVLQAEDRDNNTIRTIDSYLEIRRQNTGIRASYFPAELHLSIPDEVFYHPVIKELERLCEDLITLDNDIVSYNKEQATGDDRHNILTVVMHQFNTDLDGAMKWVVDYHKEVEAGFLDALKRVPSWSRDVDQQVAVFVEHLANWPRGNICWAFESGRYLGNKGLEYEKTRLVPMLPKGTPQ